ncbi:hypothetical protein HYV88_03615 [Candidatus Woesearchaeota archaeon]|nr:hypothetical protein [Candidatus Woesearchaeota archaeon]
MIKSKGMRCVCGKIAKYTKNLKFNNFTLGGWKCKSCSEIYYNTKIIEKILLLNRLKKTKDYLTLIQ